MEIITKINAFDKEMVELYDHSHRWLLGVIHIDNFSDFYNGLFKKRILNDEEVVLNIQMVK